MAFGTQLGRIELADVGETERVRGLAQTIAETDEGPHKPIVIRRHAELDRFVTLGSIEPILFLPDFVELHDEIETLCTSLGGGP